MAVPSSGTHKCRQPFSTGLLHNHVQRFRMVRWYIQFMLDKKRCRFNIERNGNAYVFIRYVRQRI